MGHGCTNRSSSSSRCSIWLIRDTSIQLYEIRRPSRSKGQFLLHLDDCQRKALHDLIVARQFLLEVTDSSAERSGSKSDGDSTKGTKGSLDVQPKLAAKIFMDLDYLIEALKPLGDEIERLQRSVRPSGNRSGFRQSLLLLTVAQQSEKQMNLAQMQRSMIITVLASVFIPLSFATVSDKANVTASLSSDQSSSHVSQSFFGMNISTSSNSVSNITFTGNLTASPATTFQGTQTSNNPIAWKIKYFWIVAIPLIFVTIVLPLVASPCARWILRVMKQSDHIFMITSSILSQVPYHRQWGCVALILYVGVVYIAFMFTGQFGLSYLPTVFGDSVITLWSLRRAWLAYKTKEYLYLWLGVQFTCDLSLILGLVSSTLCSYLGLPVWGIIFARYSRPLWPNIWKWLMRKDAL